jgi:uncharacterized protein
MHAQGLAADPSRKATPAAVCRQIERMGYVQIDTISVVERAHHHILMTRFDGYKPRMLAKLLERDRKLFEHWTHDLCAIPTAWFRYWRPRFAGAAARPPWDDPSVRKMMAADPDEVCAGILRRIRSEGPQRSRDFEDEKGRATPGVARSQKFALHHLLRTGTLLVTRRDGFQRVYDLAERVLPDACAEPAPKRDEIVAWACHEALDRLVVATPRELASFLRATGLGAVKEWGSDAARRGEVVEVLASAVDESSKPVRALALPDWRRRASRPPAAPDRFRLLSPFDPVIRDRERTRRLFGFRYRFEGFVPAARREFGYYVLPILEGERLVGRLDPKLHRDRGHLEIRGVWWEPGGKPAGARRIRFEEALDLYARQIGAAEWSIRKG